MVNGAAESLFRVMEESGAGIAHIELYRKEGDERPFKIIVCVDGEDECADVMAAIEAVEARWEA